MEKIFTILGWFVMASLALAIARQLSEQKTLIWNEGFMSLNPAEATLNMPRAPYALLADIIPVNQTMDTGKLTAKSCYEVDYMSKHQLTGNYDQATNNFKHAMPDSCTMPLTTLVDTIYNVKYRS